MSLNNIIADMKKERMQTQIKLLIDYIGDDPEREGLKDTPRRVIESYSELFSGYEQRPEKLFITFKDGTCDEMIVLKEVDFFSMCEHHMLPFFGTVSIGYIPNGRIIGVSKLARLVEVYARRLQVQERMTSQIADTIVEHLKPLGVIVICSAQHLCMIARGVKKQNAIMTTSAIRGAFKDIDARQEFLNLIK